MALWEPHHPAFPLQPRAFAQHDAERVPLQFRLAALTLLLLPLNWLLGTILPWVFTVAVLGWMSFYRPSALEYAYGFLAAALTLGLVVAAIDGIPGERALGSIFNLMIIVVLVGFANIGRKMQQARSIQAQPLADRVYRFAFWCFGLQIVVVGAAWGYVSQTGVKEIKFPTLFLGPLGELPGVLLDYSRIYIVISDWVTTGEVARIVGFGIYATEGAVLVLIVGLLAGIHAWQRGYIVTTILIEVAMAVALVVMNSRTTLAAYACSLLLLIALGGRGLVKVVLLCLPMSVCAAAIVVAFSYDHVVSFLDAANQSRLGSSGTRFKSYQLAIEMVLDNNLLTGLGIKPRDEFLLSIPIGSHSSWISMFTKGGMIALAAWVVLNLSLAARLIRSQSMLYQDKAIDRGRRFELANLSRCVLVLMFWWVTEDFDAPAHQAAIGGLCLGLFWGALEFGAGDRTRPRLRVTIVPPGPGAWGLQIERADACRRTSRPILART